MIMFTKHYFFFISIVISISVLVIAVYIFTDFMENDKGVYDKDNLIAADYFSDNMVRNATMKIKQKSNGNLEVKVITQITTIEGMNLVKVYPIKPAWKNHEQLDIVLEDEKHNVIEPVLIDSDSFGTFMQDITIPQCVTTKGDLVGSIELYDVTIQLQNKMSAVFAKYSLPDISSTNDAYEIKFISPYPVTVYLPDEAIIISNQTTTCVSTLDPQKKSAFVFDITMILN